VARQVYDITDSPFQLGLTDFFRALPVMIFLYPVELWRIEWIGASC
jgi:hypothetical protein